MKLGILLLSISLLCLTPVLSANAQETPSNTGVTYESIVTFPTPGGSGVSDGNSINASDFVKIVYVLAVSVAGLLAVIKIILGGVKYMLTDVIPGKEKAKKDIWGAIFGLIIVLSAVFILEIINPQLAVIKIFDGAPEIQVQTPSQSSDVAPASTPTVNTPLNSSDDADAAIANDAAGRTVLYRGGRYGGNTGGVSDNTTDSQAIDGCVSQGGTSYTILVDENDGSKRLVCYQ